ncbi:Beta-barrel assembly-enhancing protease [bacterium HR11]|nr:Beta-barrel assembly-enhancing protease [bacterium HR11]
MKKGLPSSGRLADYPVVTLLGLVYQRQDTGSLRLIWNSLEKIFWVRSGHVVAAASDLEGEHLLDFLLPDFKEAIVSRYDLWRELPLPAVMEQCLSVAGIPTEKIQAALEASIYLNLGSALSWYSAEFTWTPADPPDFPCAVRLPIPTLLWKVLQGVRDVETLWKQVHSPAGVIRLSPDFLTEAQGLGLTPQDAYFVQLLDGRAHWDHAVQVSGLSPTRAVQIACLAIACGWAESSPTPDAGREPPRASPTPAPSPAQAALLQAALYRQKVLNFYKNLSRLSPQQILMVTPQTTRSELEANYRRLLEEYDPDRCRRDPTLQDLHTMVVAIQDAVRQAYEQVVPTVPEEATPPPTHAPSPASTPPEGLDPRTLRYWKLKDQATGEAPSSRPGPAGTPPPRSVPKTPQEIARFLRLQALDYIRAGDNWQAARALENAIRLQPNDAELYFLLGTVYEKHPRLHARAAQAYTKAVELEPDNVQYMFHLAVLLYQNGQFLRAARYLERLATLDPLNVRAHELLADVRRRLARGQGEDEA